MTKTGLMQLLRNGRYEILLAILVGSTGYGLSLLTGASYADPLVIALCIGILVRTGVGDRRQLRHGFELASAFFIPVGIVFYAMKNLNFDRLAKVDTAMLILLSLVVLVYFAVILILGRLTGQRRQITYLTATGSAICGASAIAIISPAMEAEPDDISVSLLAVTLVALLGLFTILPFLATLFNLASSTYGILAGAVLQFTGFVKSAVDNVPHLSRDMPARELASLALSVKAVRYLGLLVAIPLFASLIRKKIHIPRSLWAFLGAGVCGTWIYRHHNGFYLETLTPIITPIFSLSWSIAMAAIGLNADIRQLLSNDGIKAILMAFGGFAAATATFFGGLYLIHSL